MLTGLIVQRGQEVACEPLLDWLRVSLTLRAVDQAPGTAVPPLGIPMYLPPAAHTSFLEYRRTIAQQDLPLLSSAAQQQGAQAIAQGLATLVEEQRLARQEAADQRRQRDARKAPLEFYGILLERLMRWAQVGDGFHSSGREDPRAQLALSPARRLFLRTKPLRGRVPG